MRNLLNALRDSKVAKMLILAAIVLVVAIVPASAHPGGGYWVWQYREFHDGWGNVYWQYVQVWITCYCPYGF